MAFVTNIDEISLSQCNLLLLPIDLYHTPLVIKLDLRHQDNVKEESKRVCNFKRADFNGINSYLSTVDWSLMQTTCSTDVNNCVELFYDKILFAIDLFVPLCKAKSNVHPPCFNKFILNLKNRNRKAYKSFIKSGSSSDYNVYSNLRRQLLTSIRFNYHNYINRVQSDLALDPKIFWSFVNSKKISRFPSSMFFNKAQCSSPSEYANCLQFFLKVCM